MPYALFGTCLGAITCYELAQSAVRAGLPGPVALFTAAVSPPHLYALAVMKLYVTRQLGAEEPAPLEEVLQSLQGWESLPKEVLMQASILLVVLLWSLGSFSSPPLSCTDHSWHLALLPNALLPSALCNPVQGVSGL